MSCLGTFLRLLARLPGLLARLPGLLAALHGLHSLLSGLGKSLCGLLRSLCLLACTLGLRGLSSRLHRFCESLTRTRKLVPARLLGGGLLGLLGELLGGPLEGLSSVAKILSSLRVLLCGSLGLPLLTCLRRLGCLLTSLLRLPGGLGHLARLPTELR